jgi:hypothetical protein
MLAPYNAFRKTHYYKEFVAAAEFYLHFQSPVFLGRVFALNIGFEAIRDLPNLLKNVICKLAVIFVDI